MKDQNYLRRNRGKKEPFDNTPKTEFERRKTHEEVKQIKRNLENFTKSTWSKFWVKSILKIGRPFRMQRGINYALEDRIENLLINKGHIFSTVQGTAPTPYRVNIYFQTIPESEWKGIIEEIARSPWNLIQLLEGILPEEIIKIFEERKYSLFPDIENEGLNASCSCPDKEIPCKHIAATILYIARVLDYNPFILLELKGKNKNELLKELHLSEASEEEPSISSDSKKKID
ncbi:MAG: SWIM zinc finger family protein, partial [Promethearchaeota archaeon]